MTTPRARGGRTPTLPIHYTYTTPIVYLHIHYTTLHYTTLHYTTLHYTTLHYTTLHYTTLHYTTPTLPLRYTFVTPTLHLHYTILHNTAPTLPLHYTYTTLVLPLCCPYTTPTLSRTDVLSSPWLERIAIIVCREVVGLCTNGVFFWGEDLAPFGLHFKLFSYVRCCADTC